MNAMNEKEMKVTVTLEFPDEKTKREWCEEVFGFYDFYGNRIEVDRDFSLRPVYDEEGEEE